MPCAGSQPSQQVEARRHLTKAGKVVLDEESAVIAERLGLDIVLNKLAKSLAAVGVGAAAPGLGTAEKSKSHWFDLLGSGPREPDYGQNLCEASRAPSARLASFAHTMRGSTAAWPTQVP